MCLLDRAKVHKNTASCQVIPDLQALVTKGDEFDKLLLETEADIKRGEVFTTQKVQACGNLATKIADTIKSGRKKASGLRAIMDV